MCQALIHWLQFVKIDFLTAAHVKDVDIGVEINVGIGLGDGVKNEVGGDYVPATR